MIWRNVVNEPAPRSREASSSEAGIRSRRGTSVRIANGSAITTCPIATVSPENGMPIVLNRISRAVPSTTNGITSGASMMPDTTPLAKNRRRTRAIDAGIASTVVTTAVSVATYRLMRSASRISVFSTKSGTSAR